MSTKIEWCKNNDGTKGETWNPITGCSPVSAGCLNCYAKRMANRLRGRCGYPAEEPFAVTFHPDRLDKPFHWKKPRRIFVCSMGDFLHPSITLSAIAEVFLQVHRCPQHTFIFLTKRPDRMRPVGEWEETTPWPKNIWLGVTVENQKCADERIPILLDIPAAVHFVSVEPMLEPVDLTPWLDKLDWVICGAETGPGKRHMKSWWAADMMFDCQEAKVPFFFKKDSNGNREVDGETWEEFPDAR